MKLNVAAAKLVRVALMLSDTLLLFGREAVGIRDSFNFHTPGSDGSDSYHRFVGALTLQLE